MLVKYYKNNDLKYSNRKRYKSFNYNSFNEENNRSVLLGDGAETFIKTSKDNICDYVTIDDTRWFVTSYVYLNGGQVQLFLQRDVIGENGLKDMFGKIERGYTNSVLRNRKELSLNEVLKERINLIPQSNNYANYSVDNHSDELWGIMYFSKKTALDPTTGNPTPSTNKATIPIPAFNPNYVEYPLIKDGLQVSKITNNEVYVNYTIGFRIYNSSRWDFQYSYRVNVRFYKNEQNIWKYDSTWTIISEADGYNVDFLYTATSWQWGNAFTNEYMFVFITGLSSYGYIPYGGSLEWDFSNYGGTIYPLLRNGTATGNVSNSNYLTLPDLNNYNFVLEDRDYTNLVIKQDNKFYDITSKKSSNIVYGSTNKSAFVNKMNIATFKDLLLSARKPNGDLLSYAITLQSVIISSTAASNITLSSRASVDDKIYTVREMSASESGTLIVDLTKPVVDEPYSILVFPLYNVKIKSSTGVTYNIDRNKAFLIFNTVIQYLSGDNPFLIDAQIYPYCPDLSSVSSEVLGYPFFQIPSNTYTHDISVNLFANKDVKKEYIQKAYSLISPEKSGKFDFRYYDYIKTITDGADENSNYTPLKVKIKTALKPFNLISVAVIVPEDGSLKNMTYSSDMRGSQPTNNGFQVSISSDAFETYKRQNSMYQQVFALQKQELDMQHQTERVNEITGAIVNTVTGTAMGAIAGGAMANYSVFGINASGAGAAVGGVVAGSTLAAANAIQLSQNDKLRAFESKLQQQNFDLTIATIKNLPNTINRISSFNEIILHDFWYAIEVYECTEDEKNIVKLFIENFSYGIGVFGFLTTYTKDGWFIRSTLIRSSLNPILHDVASKELMGGIYYYE